MKDKVNRPSIDRNMPGMGSPRSDDCYRDQLQVGRASGDIRQSVPSASSQATFIQDNSARLRYSYQSVQELKASASVEARQHQASKN